MKEPPLAHQLIALQRAALGPYFAFFMEQGTGKSYVTLAEAESLFLAQRISMLIIIAPNGVHLNWITRQVPKHLSVPYRTLVWDNRDTLKYKRECTEFVNFSRSEVLSEGKMIVTPLHDHLRILAFNVEAFSQKKSSAEIFLYNVMKRHRTFLVVDESSSIKNLTGAARTRHIISIGESLPLFKRILTGTPATQSPFNFYAQAKFLKPGLICGFTELTPFKSYFGEWVEKYGQNMRAAKLGNPHGTQKYKSLVRYRNLHILKSEVDKFSYTVMKKDCLDLPPKLYETRPVLMSEPQRKLYNSALNDFIVWLGEERVTIAHAFTRLTRLCQILGGFIKLDDEDTARPIEGANPKIDSVLQYVDEMPAGKKLVVWARYTAELRAISTALGGGKHCALYWGEIDGTERHENIDRFQSAVGPRFFVGNSQCGKFGIELFAASHVLYYSNSFSADARWQSEDRVHRIGQSAESVLYTDLVVPNSLDTKILGLLAAHTRMADLFKGDKAAMAEWLRTQDEALPEMVPRDTRHEHECMESE